MPSKPSAYRKGQYTIDERSGLYLPAREHQVLRAGSGGTAVTGQTSFVATTPTIMLYQSASAKRLILDRLTLSQSGTVAGGNITLRIARDTTSRYASGGTTITPTDPNGDGTAAASAATLKTNPTASADGSTDHEIIEIEIEAVTGRPVDYDFGGCVMIGATGSLMIYTFAATTGPSWKWDLRWIEETI